MVHAVWSTMINKCYKTVFSALTLKLMGWGAILKHHGTTLWVKH